jgi:hypothetical protein
MTTATNIDIKQKLQSSFSVNKPNVTSNHPTFGERVHISANDIPIKTFSNCPFSSVDPIIFLEAKLQCQISSQHLPFSLLQQTCYLSL